MKDPLSKPATLSSQFAWSRRALAVTAAGVFAAGLALVPAPASAAINSCFILLAVPVDFRRADGPGPVREVPVARAGLQGYSTGGPVALTQVSARLASEDDAAARVGLTRFGRVLAPYAFCASGFPIAEDGEGGELIPLSGPPRSASDGPMGQGLHPLALPPVAEGQPAGDDPTDAAFPAPSGLSPSSSLSAWPSFIGQLTGPTSDAATSPESWFWLTSDSYAGGSGMGGGDGMGGGPGGVGRRGAPSAAQQPTLDPSATPGSPVDPSALAAAAPEPAGWMLLLVGFGGLGGMARRRARHAGAA